MQYAVISTGGKQYIVTPGQELVIERLPQAEGESVTFDQVLLSVNGADVVTGTPTISGASVKATIVRNDRADKIRVFKYRSKSRYRRTLGHRQHQSVVKIEQISGQGQDKPSKKAATPKAAEAAK